MINFEVDRVTQRTACSALEVFFSFLP